MHTQQRIRENIGKNVFEHGFSLNEKNELVDNDGVHLATNSLVSSRSLQVLFELDRPRIGCLSWSVQVCRVALRAAGRRTRDEILIPPF